MATYYGFIKSMPEGKSFGFIKSTADPRDLFFHRDDCLCDWNDLVYRFRRGQKIRVEFEAVSGPKGLRAEGIRIGYET